MKHNWWKLIVVAVLVVAVAVVVAAKRNAPDVGTSVAEDSGLDVSAPDLAAEEAVGTPTKEEPPKSDMPSEASKQDSETRSEEPKSKPQAASTTSPAPKPTEESPKAVSQERPAAKQVTKTQQPKKRLPKIVDLGAMKCIPCKMMAPILEELKKDYEGKLEVVVIDVWENRGEAEKYGIQAIPTQIFYDENGKEFFRHEGFLPKEDILKTFRDHGIKL